MDDQQKFQDKWDNKVSVPCPNGNHVATRLPVQRVEGRQEVICVACERCGHRFDWTVPPELD